MPIEIVEAIMLGGGFVIVFVVGLFIGTRIEWRPWGKKGNGNGDKKTT